MNWSWEPIKLKECNIGFGVATLKLKDGETYHRVLIGLVLFLRNNRTSMPYAVFSVCRWCFWIGCCGK